MEETLMADTVKKNKYPIPLAKPKPKPKPVKTKKRFVIPKKKKI
jgi:hypothetical protein